jgi:DNA-binding transcriptional regulator YdaS (Cro superfamily)
MAVIKAFDPPRAQRRIEDELRLVVEVNGSQKEAARVLGISPQYLCDLLRGRREFSAAVADVLGFQRVVSYLEKP